jgi:hypothetical protein
LLIDLRKNVLEERGRAFESFCPRTARVQNIPFRSSLLISATARVMIPKSVYQTIPKRLEAPYKFGLYWYNKVAL